MTVVNNVQSQQQLAFNDRKSEFDPKNEFDKENKYYREQFKIFSSLMRIRKRNEAKELSQLLREAGKALYELERLGKYEEAKALSKQILQIAQRIASAVTTKSGAEENKERLFYDKPGRFSLRSKEGWQKEMQGYDILIRGSEERVSSLKKELKEVITGIKADPKSYTGVQDKLKGIVKKDQESANDTFQTSIRKGNEAGEDYGKAFRRANRLASIVEWIDEKGEKIVGFIGSLFGPAGERAAKAVWFGGRSFGKMVGSFTYGERSPRETFNDVKEEGKDLLIDVAGGYLKDKVKRTK